MRGFQSKLSVRLACGKSRHHRCSGNSLWVLANLAMKCSLTFRMARSAEFIQWMWGGTNWNLSFTSVIKGFSTLVHSLSRMCGLGFKPLLVKSLWSLWYSVFNQVLFEFSKVLHEWSLNHNGRSPKYIYCLCWMWLEAVLFDECKFSLSNPLSWGKQYWCLMTTRIGEIDMVLVLGLVLVLIGVPFSAWILGLSEVVEDARGRLLVFI